MLVTSGGRWIDRLMVEDCTCVYIVLSFVLNSCIWTVRLMYVRILGLIYFGNYGLHDVCMMIGCPKAYVCVFDMQRVVCDLFSSCKVLTLGYVKNRLHSV